MPPGVRFLPAFSSADFPKNLALQVSAFGVSGGKLVMKLEIVSAARLITTVFTASVALATPAILSPSSPTTNRVSLGGRLMLSVEATSSVSAVSYQWRFGSTNIVDATNSIFILNSIQTNQVGVYSVIVADAESAAASVARTVSIGPVFTKVTSGPITTGGSAQAISWGDFNHDGWVDLFCAVRSSSMTTLFTNDTHGSFGRATGTIGANLVNPIGSTWGDYDNSGTLDLFIANNNNANDSLLRNNGDGTFTLVTSGNIVSSAGNGNGCAWSDYDRDGFVDLYVANSDGNNFLFHNNGNGTFTRVTAGPMVSGTANSQGCAWIDYDNDGFPDLFVSRNQSANLLFHNNRNGTFTKITDAPMAKEGGSALGFSWGDYDNDGLPDLFVANGGTNNWLYHNDGNGTFTKTNSPTGTDSGSFQTVNWIDYDNDGWLDLFVTSVLSGTSCRLYHNNADGTFTRVVDSPLASDTGRWFAAAWADINNDGFPDVLVSNINNPNVLHRNEGNDNHWLTVRCLGRLSNRAAIGAKVRVRTTIFGRTFWQLREIASGGNIGNANQMDPMFGLGDAAEVNILRVEWPSGIIQEFHDVAANQILVIKEPSKLEAVSRANPNQVTWILRGGSGIAYDLQESADLETWSPWVSVTNLSGRMTIINDATKGFRAYRAIEP